MAKKLLLYSGLVILWILILSLTHLPLLPCQEFVSDSSQGYYPAFCSFMDEDGYFLLTSQPGYYDPIPTVWTWVGGLIVIFLLPTLVAIPLARRLIKK